MKWTRPRKGTTGPAVKGTHPPNRRAHCKAQSSALSPSTVAPSGHGDDRGDRGPARRPCLWPRSLPCPGLSSSSCPPGDIRRPGTSDLLPAAHLPFRLHRLHVARSAHKSCVLETTACRLRDRTPSHCLFVSTHKLVPCGSGVELRRLGSGETQGRDGPVPGASMEN